MDFKQFIFKFQICVSCLANVIQVGTVQEIVGNGFEAEALLLWGKNISIFQGLPVFSVSFSTALGIQVCLFNLKPHYVSHPMRSLTKYKHVHVFLFIL